jgi:phage terminase large subunit
VQADIQLPELFIPFLTQNKRYKVSYGGRGGGKTESIGRIAIIKSYSQKGVILCCREIQKSIDESVYRLLKTIIQDYGLQNDFKILINKIINLKSGCEFVFHGLRDLSVDNLKSIKGIIFCWVEEAHSVSTNSWNVLKPTIRESNSEIWVSFNRKYRRDPVWREFCEYPDDDTLIVKVNWYDNPFFPDVLKKEMERDYRNKPKEVADHIWEGTPQTKSDLRVYRFDLARNTSVSPIPYYNAVETWTMWDFGVRDSTAIAIAQIFEDPKAPNGIWINFIDEYIDRNKSVNDYKKWVTKHECYDAGWRHACDPSGANRNESLSSWVDALAPELMMEYSHGVSISEYIDLANEYMASVRINENQCPQFYDMFCNWEYPEGEDGLPKEGSKPCHDMYSHPGTAFYYFIMERFNPRYKNKKYEIRV